MFFKYSGTQKQIRVPAVSDPYFTMVLQLLSLQKVKQPLKNEPYASTLFEDQLRYVTKNIYRQIKQTPELVSMIDSVVTDHYLGPVDFFDPCGKTLGSTKLKQVKQFWADGNVQGEAFYGQGVDLCVDGSGFGWHVSPNQILTSKQKEMLNAGIKAFGNVGVNQFLEEKSNLPLKVSYLASSTVAIKYDEFGEVYYIQDAAGKRVRWETDQVVHLKLMEFNGGIRGFTPMKALIREIAIMYLLKENIQASLLNGGSMDNIIALKGANGVSRGRFKRLQTALESFSHLRKSHGNMPIDGEVTVHPIGVGLKDMEYRELAMFIISEFGLALGLPTSRVPFLMTGSGGSSNKGELSGNSEDSYQSKINARRMIHENKWNQVFRKAGFIYKFRRDNLQDDTRETMASQQRATWVMATQSSLKMAGKQLTIQAHLTMLSGSKMNISEEDVEDFDVSILEDQMIEQGPTGPGQPGQPAKINNKSKVSQDKSAAKKGTASNNNKNA